MNLQLLNKFYEGHQIVTNDASDKIPSEAYINPKLAYTQTGMNTIHEQENNFVTLLGGLPTSLQLKKWVPIMITVNSTTKRYKENGMTILISTYSLCPSH